MWYKQLEQLCSEINTTPTAFVTKELNLSSSKVTAWKNGSIPKFEILKQIADYFHITVGYLFDGKEKSSIPELTEDKCRLLEMYDKLTDMEKGEILGELKVLTKDKFITVSTAARDNDNISKENISQSEIEDFKNAKPQKY